MDVLKAIKERRTIRRFKEKEIPAKALEKCIEAARIAPSARNLQPLEYIIIHEKKNREQLLPLLHFGGVLGEKGMQKGEEPRAYIVVLFNKDKRRDYSGNDAGIAVQSIALTAWEQGIGTCIMGAIDREKIKPLLNVPDNCDIALVLAMGYPKEKPVLEESNEKTSYWIEKDTLHVPKRSLDAIMHKEKY
jgi:nitroreductase